MTDQEKSAFFRLHYAEFNAFIEKRRHKWRATSVMEFEDVSSILMARIYKQLHLYDPARPLDRWVNTLISHAMMSLLRDHVFKDARPCISGQAPGFNMGSSYGRGCACNLGGDKCSWTKSSTQDATCKFYAAWEKKKKAKFAINATLSIENHVDESHSQPDELLSEERYEEAKKVIDDNIQRRLTKEEYRIYVLLYVKHLSMEEAVKKMGFKKVDDNDQRPYMKVRSAALKAKEIAKQIISEQSLVR